MGLPSTITASGTLEFDDVSKISGTQVVYFASSPQGDLTGRPSLRVSHETTKAGITRSLVSLVIPHFNEAKLAYEGFIKVDMTLNRASTIPIDQALAAITAMKTVLALSTVAEPVSKGLV